MCKVVLGVLMVDIEYSEETMMTAIGTFRKVESFLDECELYISGVKQTGDIDEPALFKVNKLLVVI